MITEEVLVVDGLDVVFRQGRRHPDVHAVAAASLTLAPGEVLGLVGESGSGKSTLAMVVAGLVTGTGGRVTVLGQPVADLRRRSCRQLRASVQMIFQDPHGSLDPRQSIRGGFRELRRVHGERTSWATDEEVMRRVGLDAALLQRMPHQLSGGQAQRICIARALLLRPRLLIADEATSGLDVSAQAQIVNLLLELADSERIGVLFISHDLSVVRHMCDRIAVMCAGRIVESGPTEQVLATPAHDYTRRLIAALPGMHRTDAEPAPTIAGDVVP